MAIASLRLMPVLNIPKVKLNINNKFFQSRRYTSALFISGRNASETFAYLSPNLDFDRRFADIVKLQREVDCRGMNINVSELKSSWDLYKYIDENRQIVENKRTEVSLKIKSLKNSSLDDVAESIKGLSIQGTILKQDLRNIKEALWDLEETIIPRLLALPNELDEKTPMEPVIMRSVGEKRESIGNNRQNHLDIGKSLELIEYKNPLNYYLCNDAAFFEIGVMSWLGKCLNDNDIIRISGMDFSRSFVIEAAGLNHKDPFETFLIDNNENILKETCNRLHLMGNASLASFLALHTKQLINPKDLPVCYGSIGRQYNPVVKLSDLNFGLFGVGQATVLHCMALVKNLDGEEYTSQFEKLVNTALKLYDDLGLHYRVVLRPIRDLQLAENLRISFELWSSSCQDYIEVGHLSTYGNYITQRLLIAYQTPSGRAYPAMISGTILSVPKLLGCLLEEDADKFNIPLCIHAHIPVDI